MSTPPPRSPLKAGDLVPEFTGTTESGSSISSADLRGRPAVLFFYPKAGSPGCSIESREFARRNAELSAAGVRVIGISVDPLEAQRVFREDCHLPFDLIADPSREISKRFGVLGALGLARRTTFLLGADGRIVDVIRSWRPRHHVDATVARMAGLAPSADPGEPGPNSPPS